MTNLVEITVRTKDEATSSLKQVEKTAKDSGTAAGKNFSQSFNQSMGGGLLGGLFGKSGSSSVMDAQRQGQNVGLGLGRGIMQKFNQTLGSGLLSGLFGTSGGGKLFGNAGNTVVQDATKQGEQIAQGLGTGLNNGFSDTQNKISGVLSGLFSKGGSTSSDAESQGENIGKSFTKGLSDGFSKAGSSVSNILSGLFGGNGSGPDESAGEQAGKDAGNGFLSGLRSVLSNGKGGGSGGIGSAISGLFSGSSKDGSGDAGGVVSALDSGGVAGGALPGIAGVSGMTATITGLAGVLAAVLPAITSVLGGLTALGGGFAILETTNKQFAADMTSTLNVIKNVFAAAAAPLAGPFEAAAKQIGAYFQQLGPMLKSVFGDSAQLIAPLVKGFESLVSGALPGFLAMIKGAGPVFATISGAFSDLGKSLGEMFSMFAQAEAPSAVVLKALLDLINTLFPILGKLGEVFASAIAPAVAAFGAALDKVLPALTPLLSIIAQLAGAALTDLAGILGSVGTLLIGLAPSFTTLAKAAGQVFSALENDGVFASIGNAIEALATPLANLINALVKGLAPALPGIISAFSSIASAITGGLVTVLTGVANALTAIVKAIPPSVLTALADGFLAIYTAVKLWSGVQVVLNALMDANPLGAIIIAIAAVAAGFYLAWEKSSTFRDIIKDLGAVVLTFASTALTGFRDIVNAFLTLVSTIVDGAAKAFGWVPGLGGILKTAAASVTNFKNSANSDFNSAISTVQGLTNKLLGIPKNTKATVNVVASGSGGMTFTEKVASSISSGNFALGVSMATGGMVSGGIPGKDSVLINAMPGEAIVPTHLVPKVAPILAAGGVPGFASGGLVGMVPWATNAATSFVRAGEVNFLDNEYAHLKAAVDAAAKAAAASAAAASSAGSPGPGGGAPAANAALAKKLYPAWGSGAEWTAWNNVAMRESGWNQYARNPSSGAYGIPQALPPSKMGAAANPPESNPTAQINWMIGYIKSVYGDPIGAWNSELTRGWYANGGPTSSGWAMVGERGRELVKLPGGATVYPAGATQQMAAGGAQGAALVQLEVSSGGQSEFEKFMSTWIKNYVRVKGGGQVQKAFGRS